jgi:hypothetical protein
MMSLELSFGTVMTMAVLAWMVGLLVGYRLSTQKRNMSPAEAPLSAPAAETGSIL